MTFQLRSGPRDKAVTLSWGQFREAVTRAANLFRRLGVGDGDTVAFILPNGIEAAVTILAGATAGIVNPVNPAARARAYRPNPPRHPGEGARHPRALPEERPRRRVAAALAEAPGVETVLTVDLAPYSRRR